MPLHELAAGKGRQQPRQRAEAVHEPAGFFELISRPAAEHALADPRVHQLAVVVHHPVDDDLEPATVKLVGQAHVANDRALERAAGERQKSKHRLGHVRKIRQKRTWR
jgi:hypothetical protein